MKEYTFNSTILPLPNGKIFVAKNGEGYVENNELHIVGGIHNVYKFEEQRWFVLDTSTNILYNNYAVMPEEYQELQVLDPIAWEKIVDSKAMQENEKIAIQGEIGRKISSLKNLLTSWDYKTSKHADGEYTDEEWSEIVAQRKAWREEINRLEAELALYV